MQVRWEDFRRASWEENAGAVFTQSNEVAGLAFGLATPQDAPNVGEIWVDDLQLSGAASVVDEQPEEVQPAAPDENQPARRPSLPCTGGIVLPLLFISLIHLNSRKR
jgi:hypothetical protein